jgi:hypothetical protein
MNLLIPYALLRHHPDPVLNEFTYGDSGQPAHRLKSDLHKGDYVFFHIGRNGKKYITAYYVVDRVLDTVDACRDKAIRAKYKNPHIIECLAKQRPKNGEDDALVFGDPITSQVFERPILFDSVLAKKLTLNVKFLEKRTEAQAIGSATRQWRELTDKDVKVLLKELAKDKGRFLRPSLRATDEVGETLERDIENYIARNPSLLGKGLRLVRRQEPLGIGRLDLLFENKQGDLVVVELKLNRIGRDAIRQIKAYIHDLREANKESNISGVIVCSGVMPAFEEELRKQQDIRILVYGWDLRVLPW